MKKLIKISIAAITLGIYLINILGLASALTIVSVDTSPDEIAPGETADIRIGIENDWNENIEDVSIVLDLNDEKLPFAPHDSSSEQSFDEIKEDRIKYAEFEIIVLSDAKSGIYKIPLIINYKNRDGEKQTPKQSLIGITVSSKPIISAHVEEGLLLKGQENEMSIEITNKGLSDVKFLEVELQGSTYYNLLSPKNVYVGDVDSDDFESVEFKIFFKENAPNSITIPINVKYKDNLNKKYEENLNIQASVYDRKKAIELGLIKRDYTSTYIGIVIAVIVIWIIYRKIRKRRKMKKVKASA